MVAVWCGTVHSSVLFYALTSWGLPVLTSHQGWWREGCPSLRVCLRHVAQSSPSEASTSPLRRCRGASRAPRCWTAAVNKWPSNSQQVQVVGCLFYVLATYVWSYQDGYRLATVHTHGDFTVPPNWEIRPPAAWLDIPRSHIIPTVSQPVLGLILLRLSTRLGSDKISIIKIGQGLDLLVSG